MSRKQHSKPRGRPRTLKRDCILQVAVMRYWTDGPTAVSINAIGLDTGASKPGIYREFGSDDGLKKAVLETYSSMVLNPLFEILNSDQTFEQALDALIEFAVQERDVLGLPNGCLFAIMRSRYDDFGPLTKKKIDQLRQQILINYEDWIDRAKGNNQFDTDIPTDVAALYFDAQNGSAMRLQKDGVSNGVIAKILNTAFFSFRKMTIF
jgi:AcrR family transcriptional regulator